MPLIKSKSPKAFKKNVQSEMDAGHPQKQSLAIAYATQRRAPKKMSEGGMVNTASEDAMLKENDSEDMMDSDMDSDSIINKIMKGRKFADGGLITSPTDEGRSDLDGDMTQHNIFDERNEEVLDESIDGEIEDLDAPHVGPDMRPEDSEDQSILSRIRRKVVR